MPKAVPRNSRAIVVQLVTNIETGNEKGYGHFSCRIFSAYGPEFHVISLIKWTCLARDFLHVATASSNWHELALRNIFRSDLPFVCSGVLPVHKETRQTVARAPEGRCPWRGEGVCLGARDTDLTHPCLMNTHAIGMLHGNFRINTDLHVTQ